MGLKGENTKEIMPNQREMYVRGGRGDQQRVGGSLGCSE